MIKPSNPGRAEPLDRAEVAAEPQSNAFLFVSLWALSFLIHQLKHTPWSSDLPTSLAIARAVMVLAALGVIWRPANVRMVLLMVGAQVASVLILLPGMSNCWLFTGLVGVGILGAAVYLRWTGPGRLSTEAIYAQAVPLLRTSLLLLYGFAALAKYNYGFLDPETSCAGYIARLFAESMGLPFSDGTAVLSAWGAILFETAIPIMLFLPATRRHGILLGMVFHTLLAHDSRIHVFDFNAMLFAMYVTFLPTNFVEQIRRSPDANWICRVVGQRRNLIGALVIMSLGVLWWSCRADALGALYQYRATVWFVLGAALTGMALQSLFFLPNADFQRPTTPFRLRTVFDYLVIGIVAFNGLSPYLGLKTVVSFTMFSNLRTEAGFENSAIMPTWLRCFDWQDEPVRMIDSSAPELAEAADRGDLLLLFDLRLRAQRLGEHSVTYERDGTIHDVPKMAEDPYLGRPLPYLITKTQLFRPIQTRGDKPQW